MSIFNRELDSFLSNRRYTPAERAAYAAYFKKGGTVATVHPGGLISRRRLVERKGWEAARPSVPA